MDGRLRNMTGLYLRRGDKLLLLYRIGSKIIADSYTASAGGHFEKEELNDAKACVLRELYEETGLTEQEIDNLSLRYVTLRLKNGVLIKEQLYEFTPIEVSKRVGVTNKTIINRCAKLSNNGFLIPIIVRTRVCSYQLSEFAKSNEKQILKKLSQL